MSSHQLAGQQKASGIGSPNHQIPPTPMQASSGKYNLYSPTCRISSDKTTIAPTRSSRNYSVSKKTLIKYSSTFKRKSDKLKIKIANSKTEFKLSRKIQECPPSLFKIMKHSINYKEILKISKGKIKLFEKNSQVYKTSMQRLKKKTKESLKHWRF